MSEPEATALVIVRPASGREPPPDVAVTTENLADHLPSAEDGRAARQAFTRAGFAAGPLVGICFSITGPLPVFEALFGAVVQPAEGGGFVAAASEAPSGTRHLPLAALPADLARRLVAVTFEPPAELFGPGQAGPW